MVEGAHLLTSRNNVAKNSVHILEHIPRRNAHHSKPFAPQHRVASRIAPRLVAVAMPLSVHLNHQAPFETGKIDGHFTYRKLFPELEALGSLSKLLPEQHLRQTHFPAQRTGALHLLDGGAKDFGIDRAWAPSTMLRMVPLPVPGRN
jgi:hypothetical protein